MILPRKCKDILTVGLNILYMFKAGEKVNLMDSLFLCPRITTFCIIIRGQAKNINGGGYAGA